MLIKGKLFEINADVAIDLMQLGHIMQDNHGRICRYDQEKDKYIIGSENDPLGGIDFNAKYRVACSVKYFFWYGPKVTWRTFDERPEVHETYKLYRTKKEFLHTYPQTTVLEWVEHQLPGNRDDFQTTN